MYRKVIGTNIVFWAFLAFLLAASVNWRLCTIQRGRYLLGIYYNGFYQNKSDGIVYQDYLKTHGVTDEFIRKNI